MNSDGGDQLAAANAADFVRRFEEFWRAPVVGRLDTLLAEGVCLAAPMVPTTHSLPAGEQVFQDLFDLIPDLRAEVDRWGPTGDGVLIEFTASGTAGGGPVSWRGVDRFSLDDDGLAIERETYFDSLPLILTLARRPRAWPGYTRSRIVQARR